ncbi:MAG TPA: tail fiber domain-containing protein [Chitinophagales bacterium]|nr:tail fiber domain-containing protein [Chitinophagales bacterium]
MKKIKNYLASIFLVAAMPLSSALAQNSFPSTGSTGIGTTAPNASALLEVKSTTKGVLIPRMTKTQRDVIASPATGLLIYQTNSTPGFYYFDGSSWTELKNTGANKNLNNLKTPTAVNVDMLPGTNNAVNLGSASTSWKDVYLDGDIYMDDTRVLSFPFQTNSFIGNFAGNSTSTGIENTITGYNSLSFNTNGSYNTATGSYALGLNTTGNFNTANGRAALYMNTTGYDNTAIGGHSLYSNTSGYNNTAVGVNSLVQNSFGVGNTAMGHGTLYTNTSGHYNTAIGFQALQWNTDAQNNTAVGAGAGYLFTYGWNNTLIGEEAEANGSGYYNTIALGQAATVTDVSQARIGNSETISIGGFADWTNISDGRYKKNIKEDVKGIEFINKLRPVTYTLDVTGLSTKLNEGRGHELNAQMKTAITDKEKIIYSGFIAQEVEKAAIETGYDFNGVDKPKDDNGLYGLRYAEFVVPLVKAVQELSKQNDDLNVQIENQQKQIDELKSMIQTPADADTKKEAITLNGAATLEQNSPNPFNQQTTIRYTVPADYHSATIQISDMKGHVLKTYSINQAGKGELIINAGELASGTYQNSLVVDGAVIDTKQMMLAK